MQRTRSILLLLLLGLAICLPTRASAQPAPGQTPVAGPPSITIDTVQKIVAGTPLAPFAQEIMFFGQQHNIDPAFALAIWTHESSLDTTGVSKPNNNPGNLICQAAHQPPASGCSGRWAVYPDLSAAIADWYRYIDEQYVKGGLGHGLLSTVEALLPIYAPPTENDTAGYIAQVNSLMQQWGSGTVGTASGQSAQPAQPGGFFGGIIDSSVMQPGYWLMLQTARSTAAGFWYINRAFLSDVLMIEHARMQLMTVGFPPVLDRVAALVNNAAQPTLIAAFGLAMLSMVLAIFFRVRLANLKTVVVLCLLLPVLLPLVGSRFRDFEQARSDAGGALFEMAFGASAGSYTTLTPPAQPTGAETIGPLRQLDPTIGPAHHGADVAAAYLLANLSDVDTQPGAGDASDLPVAFAKVFFPKAPWDLAQQPPNDRATALAVEQEGVYRMGSGIVLVAFAFLEALSNILWTLAFGFLVAAILLAALFSWIPAVEQMLASLARRVLSLFFASWGVAIMQGIMLAILFGVAESGNSGKLLGAAIVAAFVLLLCVGLAIWAFAGAVVGTIAAITGGMALAAHVRQAADLTARGTQVAGQHAMRGAAFGVRGGVTGATVPLSLAGAAGSIASVYQTARGSRLLPEGERASRRYALTYALADRPVLGKAGALARAMGTSLPEDMERAIATRRGAGKGDPHGHRAVRGIQRDVAALKSGAAPATEPTPPPSPPPPPPKRTRRMPPPPPLPQPQFVASDGEPVAAAAAKPRRTRRSAA